MRKIHNPVTGSNYPVREKETSSTTGIKGLWNRDKEAQEGIVKRIGGLSVHPESLAKDILAILRGLGYRKLPKDKPPLLSNKEMHQCVGPVYDLSHDKVAQAQREADIKHYEQ